MNLGDVVAQGTVDASETVSARLNRECGEFGFFSTMAQTSAGKTISSLVTVNPPSC
jgi:hypothetical protein